MGVFILEHVFNIDVDCNGNLDIDPFACSCVKSSNVSYKRMRDAMMGKPFEGEIVATRHRSKSRIQFFSYHNSTGKSLTEWIIELNLNKGITLDFERYVCAVPATYLSGKDIVIMEKDLRTGEVLYTNPDHAEWLDQMKRILTESEIYANP